MTKKRLQIIFILVFGLFLILPVALINWKDETVSEAEKRILAPKAKLILDNGNINLNFATDFETWINDNIGLRSPIIIANAKLQYHIFDVLSNNSDMLLGPHGEFNYATEYMIQDYQHKNLYSEEYLKEFTDSFQTINDYLATKEIDLFYYQCRDKHSIYPEYFPNTVIQYGEFSKTDGMISALNENTTINVIDPKQDLIDAKKTYQTYSRYGDPTHWSYRGAYVGYLRLMNDINSEFSDKYDVLSEDDYNIVIADLGTWLFGGIHEEDILEYFSIKDPKAIICNEKLTLYSEDDRHSYWVNDAVNNDTRVLILGDSYFNSYLVDGIA